MRLFWGTSKHHRTKSIHKIAAKPTQPNKPSLWLLKSLESRAVIAALTFPRQFPKQNFARESRRNKYLEGTFADKNISLANI